MIAVADAGIGPNREARRTVVVTGGTDGIGAAVARALVARGDHVVALGTNRDKAEGLRRDVAGMPGLEFVPADLSLVATNRRVVEQLLGSHPVIDAVVLCARHFRSHRRETGEGFEDNFALTYLSRHVLSHGLRPALERAERPVIINVAGPGHDTPVAWDDLQSRRNYDGVGAMFLSGRLCDLLGVSFAQQYGDGPVRYVLFHPGTTATGFVGEYDPETAAFIERQRTLAKPATVVAPRILQLVDAPPRQPLTAFTMDSELDVHGGLFPRPAAERLAAVTEELLADGSEVRR